MFFLGRPLPRQRSTFRIEGFKDGSSRYISFSRQDSNVEGIVFGFSWGVIDSLLRDVMDE